MSLDEREIDVEADFPDITVTIEKVDGIDIYVGEPTGIPGKDGKDGVTDYEELENKPSIEGTTLIGNKELGEIGVGIITPQEIDNLLFGV